MYAPSWIVTSELYIYRLTLDTEKVAVQPECILRA